ncbi:hypothetical protein [Williamsia serinedens]|uniref:hypothetical protein n=1 Tax=Williamsia serinedens TaxID=391736 RepID=UPI002FEC66ED
MSGIVWDAEPSLYVPDVGQVLAGTGTAPDGADVVGVVINGQVARFSASEARALGHDLRHCADAVDGAL